MQRCFALLFAAVLLTIPSLLLAGVFASGIHFTNPDSTAFDGSVSDGTGLRINYALNDTASAVELRIQNATTNAVIQTLNLTNLAAGWNTALWDGSGAPPGSASYYVTIIASRAPRSATTYRLSRVIFSGLTGFNIFTRGVDVVREQTNSNFGYLYTSNAGGPIGRGFARYTNAADAAPGTGDANPFLPQSAANTNGVPWTNDASAPIHATIDSLGRVFASDFTAGQIWRMDSNTAVPKRIIRCTEPKGIAMTGTGANLRIYVASAGQVLRADIGTNDTLAAPLVTVANLGGTVRDIIFDDQGFMYVSVRSGTGFEGTAGGITYRFDVTGILPLSEFDALWSLTWTGFPIGLGHWSGTNLASATDDIIYVSHRSATTTDPPGIYRLTQLTTFAPLREHLFRPSDVPNGGGGDCSSRADLTVDPVGNVVWFENGNEEIIHIEPPSSQATVSFTTRSAATFQLGTTSVERDDSKGTPDGYALQQNYPNPFNPTTSIEFSVLQSGFVTLKVYDLLGKEVATLVNEPKGVGNYRVAFDARDLPSGTFFYTLRSGSYVEMKKMILMK